MLLLLMNCEEFWEILPLMLYIIFEGTDTSDNEALLYVVLLIGVKAAFSMLLKKSFDWIVDDNVWFEAVETLLVGVVLGIITVFTLS